MQDDFLNSFLLVSNFFLFYLWGWGFLIVDQGDGEFDLFFVQRMGFSPIFCIGDGFYLFFVSGTGFSPNFLLGEKIFYSGMAFYLYFLSQKFHYSTFNNSYSISRFIKFTFLSKILNKTLDHRRSTQKSYQRDKILYDRDSSPNDKRTSIGYESGRKIVFPNGGFLRSLFR